MTDLTAIQEASVLVFGANGFLGSLITKKLHSAGYKVFPVVRPGAQRSRINNIQNLSVLEVDSNEWTQLVYDYSPNAVVCAQWSGVSKRDRGNIELQESNINPILNIAIAVNESRVRNFICLGSQAEAKESAETIAEDFYDSGESAYGRTKAKLHAQLASLFWESECRFIWARVFSVYGPSDFSQSLLMQLFRSETTGKQLKILNPLKLWSYLYEDDFSSAIEQILKTPTMDKTVNIGNPVLSQIREIVAMWEGNSQVDFAGYPESQSRAGYFPELTKLMTEGWAPSISLEDGINRTRKAFLDCDITE
jgi:UDP-glucose 4-epimerase